MISHVIFLIRGCTISALENRAQDLRTFYGKLYIKKHVPTKHDPAPSQVGNNYPPSLPTTWLECT
jgi:hypothetical protein